MNECGEDAGESDASIRSVVLAGNAAFSLLVREDKLLLPEEVDFTEFDCSFFVADFSPMSEKELRY